MANEGESIEERRAEFDRRLRSGDYEQLYDKSIRMVIEQAELAPVLQPELGALRVALAKLIHEEQDAGRLVAGVTKLTAAAVQVFRMRQSLVKQTDGILAETVNQILASIGNEA